MFDIKNSRDFFGKLMEDFADLQQHETSARHAINCAITAYHMHEWVWGDWLKTSYATWAKLGIRDKDTFLAWSALSFAKGVVWAIVWPLSWIVYIRGML